MRHSVSQNNIVTTRRYTSDQLLFIDLELCYSRTWNCIKAKTSTASWRLTAVGANQLHHHHQRNQNLKLMDILNKWLYLRKRTVMLQKFLSINRLILWTLRMLRSSGLSTVVVVALFRRSIVMTDGIRSVFPR